MENQVINQVQTFETGAEMTLAQSASPEAAPNAVEATVTNAPLTTVGSTGETTAAITTNPIAAVNTAESLAATHLPDAQIVNAVAALPKAQLVYPEAAPNAV